MVALGGLEPPPTAMGRTLCNKVGIHGRLCTLRGFSSTFETRLGLLWARSPRFTAAHHWLAGASKERYSVPVR